MPGKRTALTRIAWILSIVSMPGYSQVCAEYACDSAVVRHILDENGRLDVDVSEVSRLSDGRITGLSMQYLGLDTLSPEVGRLSALTHLGIDRNEIRELPASIGQLTSLVSLLLDNNRLTGLPPELGELASLQRLIVFSNSLVSVPPEIGRLASLKYLRLDNNQLPELPVSLVNLNPTEGLDFQNNRLCDVPIAVEEWISAFSTDSEWKASQTRDGLNACPVLSLPRGNRVFNRRQAYRRQVYPFAIIFASPAGGKSSIYGLKGDRIDSNKGLP